ncbi:MAG: helix-turn-helix domain-containing protein [Prolixibacteraceae bacterium]
MLLYLSITGIVLSLILLFYNAGKFRSTIYLGLFFLSLSIYALNDYIILYSNSVFFITIFATNITFISYLIGPMLYWYIRSILTDNSGLRRSDLWHFIPSFVYFAAALPYMLSSFANKGEIAKEIVNDAGFLGSYKFTILSDIFSNTAVYLSRPILVLVYTLWSIGLLVRYLKHRSFRLVFSGQYFMTTWLSFLLGFQMLLVSCHLLSIYHSFINASDVFFTMNLLQVLSAVGLIGLMVSLFLFPDILYGLPKFADPYLFPQPELAHKTIPDNSVKMKVMSPCHNFESDYILLIQQKSDSCMKEFQPYLQPELNMNKFSDIIQLPAHHVAYYFREVRRQSFNDYINECRVEYAKTLMMEGKTSDLTIEAVGVLSGFTNRSTFFRAFKKVDGISPGSFLTAKGKILAVN